MKRVVDSVCVIIGNIIPDKAAQMILIEDDRVIEEISAAASNPAFGDL